MRQFLISAWRITKFAQYLRLNVYIFNTYSFCLIFAKVFILGLNHSKTYLNIKGYLNCCKMPAGARDQFEKRKENINESSKKKPWKYNREDCIVSLTWEWPSSATQLCMTTTRISRWNEMHFMLWRFTVTACTLSTRFFFTKKSKKGLQNGNPWLDWHLGVKVSQ